MILMTGERLVWAAAFERRVAEIRKETGRALSPEQRTLAVMEAWGAVYDLRGPLSAMEAYQLGEEAMQMLRAMLGDEG
jgi:hypothetical protein